MIRLILMAWVYARRRHEPYRRVLHDAVEFAIDRIRTMDDMDAWLDEMEIDYGRLPF